MSEIEGTRTFGVAASRYDTFMGRYSVRLAQQFADRVGVTSGQRAVDVGSGPGALTGVLVERLGADAVAACDPSPSFLAECSSRNPGVRTAVGPAESIPFETDGFDLALAQLVFHFVSEPARAVSEMMRVVRPGGCVAACVWDFENGMQMLRTFWDAALAIDPEAPDEARTLAFGRPGEIADLFAAGGMDGVVESTLEVSSTYDGFDELWNGFLGGVGPAGAYLVSLDEGDRARVRSELFDRLDRPTGSLTLGAVARCATGVTPGAS